MAKIKIGFEDLAPDGDFLFPIPDGYAGLHWENFGVRDPSGLSSGYDPHTGEAVGFNGFGEPASFSADTDFTFKSGFFSAAWSDDLSVTVNAYDDGVLVGTQTFTVDYGENQHMKFKSSTMNRFESIDMIQFISYGGTDHDPNDNGQGSNISVDDLQLTDFSPPPAAVVSDLLI